MALQSNQAVTLVAGIDLLIDHVIGTEPVNGYLVTAVIIRNLELSSFVRVTAAFTPNDTDRHREKAREKVNRWETAERS